MEQVYLPLRSGRLGMTISEPERPSGVCSSEKVISFTSGFSVSSSVTPDRATLISSPRTAISFVCLGLVGMIVETRSYVRQRYCSCTQGSNYRHSCCRTESSSHWHGQSIQLLSLVYCYTFGGKRACRKKKKRRFQAIYSPTNSHTHRLKRSMRSTNTQHLPNLNGGARAHGRKRSWRTTLRNLKWRKQLQLHNQAPRIVSIITTLLTADYILTRLSIGKRIPGNENQKCCKSGYTGWMRVNLILIR